MIELHCQPPPRCPRQKVPLLTISFRNPKPCARNRGWTKTKYIVLTRTQYYRPTVKCSCLIDKESMRRRRRWFRMDKGGVERGREPVLWAGLDRGHATCAVTRGAARAMGSTLGFLLRLCRLETLNIFSSNLGFIRISRRDNAALCVSAEEKPGGGKNSRRRAVRVAGSGPGHLVCTHMAGQSGTPWGGAGRAGPGSVPRPAAATHGCRPPRPR